MPSSSNLVIDDARVLQNSIYFASIAFCADSLYIVRVIFGMKVEYFISGKS